jgi:MFS family permease
MTMMIVAPLSARFVERLGTKRVVTTGLSLIALGLALMSTIHAASPYLVVISYFLIMSVGMGMTMAPATESVMGSLPRAKAGVGSAVNDTTRQVGGALGVAIIGSVVSSVYAADIASIGGRFGIGATDLALAESSLGGAQQIAPSLGERSDAFLAAANDGFVHSLSIGLRIAAAIIVFAAVMAWRFLPAHARSFETLPLHESGTDKIPVGAMAAVAGD